MRAPFKEVVLEGVATGPVSARVFCDSLDDKTAPVVLYLHGGAFLDKAVYVGRPVAECLADAGAIVVDADCSGPTDNGFPKSLEYAYGVLEYLARKRELGGKKSLLLVAGEESGGNLAAGVALKARDQMPGMLDGQVLISPLLDPFMGSKSFQCADRSGMRERWSEGWNHYLGFLGGVCHPYAAPRFCSRLSGVAPTLLLTAEDDPLRDESVEYGKLLEKAGVSVQQRILPAGMGWARIYGGQSTDEQTWQGDICKSFKSFIDDIRVRPG
ncbi:alpha/beta hydrolase fold domain-containing protein [Rhizobium tumorigenes]|uniref:Alpha/beta hydrolase n=1 Tax=Rhizobium tumorigenes TaxID=2041385 RepID=A0AAF1K6R7_9HYPH|nr:alpha/beta hydrolase [Rhizobium tumorigenes]WFR97273.1 alpha/beta hydrolase [Rhizobium tumorigenes]